MGKAYWLVFVDNMPQLLTVQLHAEVAQGPHKATVTYMERDLTDNHYELQHRAADNVCLVANLEPPAAAQLHYVLATQPERVLAVVPSPGCELVGLTAVPCVPAVQPVPASAVQVSAATTVSGRGSRPPAPVLQVLCFAGLQFNSVCRNPDVFIRGHFDALYKQVRGVGTQDTHLCGDRSQSQRPLPLGGLVGLRLSQRSRAARR